MSDARSKSHAIVAPRVRVRRVLDAPRGEVFAAWTDGEAMRHWMRPGPMKDVTCEMDVREGGRYRIVMLGAGGERWEHEGEYRAVEPPNRLEFTWVSTLTDGHESVVTVELFERGDRTELVLTHERLPHAEASERHGRGWTAIVDALAEHLSAAGEAAGA